MSASGFIGLAIHLILHKQPWSEHTQHRTDVAHNHLQSMTSSFSVTKLAQQTAFQEVLARPSLLLSPPAGDQGQTLNKMVVVCRPYLSLVWRAYQIIFKNTYSKSFLRQGHDLQLRSDEQETPLCVLSHHRGYLNMLMPSQ